MEAIPLRRLSWVLTLAALASLSVAAVMLLNFAAPGDSNWREAEATAIVTTGAAILGLLIVRHQPRNRYGWLWLVYALARGIRVLSLSFFLSNHSRATGYSALGYALLWLSEPANMATLLCMVLLTLWFPNGQLPSRRWRFVYAGMLAAALLLTPGFFAAGMDWNGPAGAGGVRIENPFGWLPAEAGYLSSLGFFILLATFLLAALSLVFRFRSAGPDVRLQIRWFVLGGLLFALLTFLPVLLIGAPASALALTTEIVGYASISLLYLAVGVAITRYRLWDIDVIVRRTLVYSVLTGVLALAYFGTVLVLQSAFRALTGQGQNSLVIVLSTLAVAALVGPVRRRVQQAIDRRFFRRKYDAARTLAGFGAAARDETDLDRLSAQLVAVVHETMEPASVELWLRRRT